MKISKETFDLMDYENESAKILIKNIFENNPKIVITFFDDFVITEKIADQIWQIINSGKDKYKENHTENN